MDSIITSGLKGIGDYIQTALFSTVFPGKCLVCDALFQNEIYPAKSDRGKAVKEFSWLSLKEAIHQLMAPYLCQSCLSDFLPIGSPICKWCGKMFDTADGKDHPCGVCIRFPKPYRMARAVAVYSGACMKLIHAYKFRGKVQLAQPLGILLFNAYLFYFSEASINRIVPVPLHPKRFRQRGFNQVYLLVRKWPEWLREANGIPNEMPGIDIGRDDLIRNRLTDPQTRLGRQQRVSNVKGVFSVKDPTVIEDKAILLVDDVYTTGATIDACTKVLLQNGARSVDVLTLARAI